jgi:hypothetical protein
LLKFLFGSGLKALWEHVCDLRLVFRVFWYGVQPDSIFPDKHWMRQCATTFHVRCKAAFCLVHFSLQYHWLTWLIYPEQMRCSQCWNASWLHGMMFLNRFICSSVSLILQSRTSSSSCLLVTAVHYRKSLKKGFQLAYWLLVGQLYVHHVNSLCACPFVCTAQASAWLLLAVPCWTAVIWYWPLEILGNLALTWKFAGFNVETVEYKNISFTVWDVGGQDKVLTQSSVTLTSPVCGRWDLVMDMCSA